MEHRRHVGDAADVPGGDVTVEGRGVLKHIGHVGDAADVPGGDVSVESAHRVEQAAHVLNFGNIPGANRAVRIPGGVVLSLKICTRPVFITFITAGINRSNQRISVSRSKNTMYDTD